MKGVFAIFLSAALLLPMGVVTHAEETAIRPFCMVNWSGDAADFKGFTYCWPMPWFYTSKGWLTEDPNELKVSVKLYDASDIKTIAQKMKEDFDNRPEGARYFNLNTLTDTFKGTCKDLVDFTGGVARINTWLTAFLAEYQSIGGKLDGVAVDLEYIDAYYYYIGHDSYGADAGDKGTNKDIYNQIVANPVYQERIRPKLVERGFEFYVNPDVTKYPERSEIWTISLKESEGGKSGCRAIWDLVIDEILAEFINEAALVPLLQYYPNATLSDYQQGDSYSWLKGVNDRGSVYTRNSVKAGNTSNFNFYDYRPVSGQYFNYKTDAETNLKKRTVYKTPPSFNNAVYEDTPFSGSMWEVNLHKRLLASTDTGLINTWLTFFNYGKRYSRTPYYAETILHAGLLDPKPFFGYIIESEVFNKGKDDPDPDVCAYDYNIQVVEDLMVELTRVVGAADRKPIQLPINWNGSYMLSGMYAGGRNVWRITPDTTKVALADFKVQGDVPTFCVDGLTITFPQGKIIEDGNVTSVGTCGYWVETPVDVTPVITSTADRYAENPAFAENFEGYKTGTFTNASVYPNTYWNINGTAEIVEKDGNKAVALSGNTNLSNTVIPQNITAGDEYAKHQTWEITVTLPSGDYGDLQLLYCLAQNDGFKISNGKVYYGRIDGYQEISDVTMSAGTYTLRREMNFTDPKAITNSLSVYDSAGNRLGGVENIPVPAISLPVTQIAAFCKNTSDAVILDNYKLYPTGFNTVFELFDAKFGQELSDLTATRTEDTAYRLSWLNATGEHKTARIYDSKSGNTLELVDIAPGMDGVATGVMKADGKEIQIAMELYEGPADSVQIPDGNKAEQPDQTPSIKLGLIALLAALGIAVIGGGFALLRFARKSKKKEENTDS